MSKTKSVYSKLMLGFAGIVGVSALSVGVEASALPKDMDKVPVYAKPTIEKLYKQGKVSGFQDGTFKPLNTLTRAEFIAMIMRSYNFEISEYDKKRFEKGEIVFTDLDKMSNFQKETMKNAYFAGIINGSNYEYKDGVSSMVLNANKKITREEMAAILVNANKKIYGNVYLDYDEQKAILAKYKQDGSKVSSWAVSGVATAINEGLMGGTSATSIGPKNLATRVDAALLMDRLETSSKILPTTPNFTGKPNYYDISQKLSKFKKFGNLAYVNPIGSKTGDLNQITSFKASDFRYPSDSRVTIASGGITATNEKGENIYIVFNLRSSDNYENEILMDSETNEIRGIIFAEGQDVKAIYNELVNVHKLKNLKAFENTISDKIGSFITEEDKVHFTLGNEWAFVYDSYSNFKGVVPLFK